MDDDEGNESDGSWVNVSHSEDELPYIDIDESEGEEGESEDEEDGSEDEESRDSEEEVVDEEVNVRFSLIYCRKFF